MEMSHLLVFLKLFGILGNDAFLVFVIYNYFVIISKRLQRKNNGECLMPFEEMELFTVLNYMLYTIPPEQRQKRFQKVTTGWTPHDLRCEWLEFLRQSWGIVFPYSNLGSNPQDLWYSLLDSNVSVEADFLNVPSVLVDKCIDNAFNVVFPQIIVDLVFLDTFMLEINGKVFVFPTTDRKISQYSLLISLVSLKLNTYYWILGIARDLNETFQDQRSRKNRTEEQIAAHNAKRRMQYAKNKLIKNLPGEKRSKKYLSTE